MEDQKRPIQADDLYSFSSIKDPQISPDGQWVAYVRMTIDKSDNSYQHNIWVNNIADNQPIQLTRGNKDTTPRWSHDSNMLAFTSARGGKNQVYLLPLSSPGGEARQLTTMSNGANNISWSPDGKHIAFLSALNAQERLAENDKPDEHKKPLDKLEKKYQEERKEEDEKKSKDPYHMWRIPYRQGTSFIDERYAQIYIIAVDENPENKPRRLTDTNVNYGTPMWSSDGQYIYTDRQIDQLADEPFRDSAIYSIEVVSGEQNQLTDETHSCFSPIPSPDGKWIAYTRSPVLDKGGLSESIPRLTIISTTGGEPLDLNIELDQSPVAINWSADGQSIAFITEHHGRTPIYRIDVENRNIHTILDEELVATAFSISSNDVMFFSASTPVSPTELFMLDSSEHKQITRFNEELLNKLIIQETHEMWFTTPSGNKIQGWYILPVDYKQGVKYPLALNIHGGPHAMWGPSISSMFLEWQLHAAKGYAVFYCNPRGSAGYGEAFQKALHATWGEVAFEDIMAGVDTLLEKDFVDEKRMAVTGGSYGGYMTAWIVGHTDRFVSAVSQRGVYNLISFYGTSDVPSLISGEFDFHPWENHELLWKHSPLAYAQNIKTPLLLIHAENDFRVPIEQAEQLFAFVRRSGGTVEMLRYPRDGHELSRSGEPEHQVSRLNKMVEWFDKHTK